MSQMSRLGIMILMGVALALSGCSRKSDARVVSVVMKKYSITPSEIRLKAGETVRFEVSTSDVQHGFDVPDLGIKEPVQPGRPAIFEFKADKKGTYAIECGIICGPRHDEMTARLIVE